LTEVPYSDFIQAMVQELPSLMASLDSDTRNVLLTLARVWITLETDVIYSKPAAADRVIPRLPVHYQLVLQRAKAIYVGEENEYWNDLNIHIKPCANFIFSKINNLVASHQLSEHENRTIKIDRDSN